MINEMDLTGKPVLLWADADPGLTEVKMFPWILTSIVPYAINLRQKSCIYKESDREVVRHPLRFKRLNGNYLAVFLVLCIYPEKED